MDEIVKIQQSEIEQIEKALEAIKHPDIDVDNTPTLVVANKYSSDPDISKHPIVSVEVKPTEFVCKVIYVRDEYKKEISPLTFEKIQKQIRGIKEMLKPEYISVHFDENVMRYIQDETTR